MKKIILAIYFLFFCSPSWSHEQWLLSTKEMKDLSNTPAPYLFTHLTWLNSLLISFAICSILIWLFVTRKNTFNIQKISKTQINWALFCLRLWTGLMLLLCALGLLPKSTIPVLMKSTLFAPDLLIDTLPSFWHSLQWIELGLGFWLVIGFFTRWAGFLLLALISVSLCLYGLPMIHYSGFYIGISLFLIINGGGEFSLWPNNKIIFNPLSLLLLQFLTGVNFIYSALCVKWATPNVDIVLLQKTHAYTFDIPYDTFVLIMLILEIIFGLLFILGRQLRFISLLVLGLFLFTSINLSETILAHSFIYGILCVFIFLGGYPFLRKNYQIV